jgi:hypothetical protein
VETRIKRSSGRVAMVGLVNLNSGNAICRRLQNPAVLLLPEKL